MRTMPNTEIVEDSPTRMVYRDLGPWNEHPTITNRAEEFVDALVSYGHLGKRRMFYYDSENELTELLIRDGRFAGFAFPVQNNEATRACCCG